MTVLGAGVDGAVRRISTTFEVRGMRVTITSFDNPSVGAGSLVNQVQFAYNDFGQLTHDYQSHAGAVVPMTTPKVQYLYASGADNTTRPTAIVHPNGRVVAYGYGEPGSLDDCASRVKTISDGGNPETSSSSSSPEAETLVEYVYLGHNTFIEVDYTEPNIRYTLIGTEGDDDPDTGDIYRGLDRFGRIKDNYWYNYSSSTDVDRIKYGYDRNGNRTYRQNVVAEAEGKHFDEKYLYDALDRLKSLDPGTLDELKAAIVDSTFGQCWTLDETGNWHGFKQDDDGDGNWNLIQQRVANKVNEITDIDNTAGPTWVTPAYDPAGNMTTIPQPADPSQAYTATYAPWNRLTKIEDETTSNTIAAYQYDGAKRRILQHNYEEGVLAETRHLYYTQPSQWQVIEERVNSSTTPDRQFIWGQRYIDDLILRDREEERLYALQDANWNVTAIVDATGTVQERYAYTAYGVPLFLDADFDTPIASLFDWETLFCSYRWDTYSRIYHVRNRVFLQHLGTWGQREALAYLDGYNLYAALQANPIVYVDFSGGFAFAIPLILVAVVAVTAVGIYTSQLTATDVEISVPTLDWSFGRLRGQPIPETRQGPEPSPLPLPRPFDITWPRGGDRRDEKRNARKTATKTMRHRRQVVEGSRVQKNVSAVGLILRKDFLNAFEIVIRDFLFRTLEKQMALRGFGALHCEFVRHLQYETSKGRCGSGTVSVGLPEHNGSEWQCTFSIVDIPVIGSQQHHVYGEDSLHALLICLRHIRHIIQDAESHGVWIWWAARGDLGVFEL